MSLVWHIVKKDLRHVWPLVACWFALIGMRIGLLFYLTYSASMKVLNQLDPIGVTGVIADGLLVAAIVRAVVQDDAQVGDRGFWMTRPIGWGRLLAAKLTAVAIVCVVGPLVALVPLWIGLGYSAIEIWRCVVFEAGVYLGIVLLAFAGASVTRTAAAFWISTVVFVIVTFVVGVTIIETQQAPVGLLTTRLWLSVLVLLTAICAAVLAQYATRRVGTCVAVILSGTVTSLVISASWSQEIRFFEEVVREGKNLNKSVKVEWRSEAVTLGNELRQKGPSAPVLVGTLQVPVPVAASAVSVRLSQVKWTDEQGYSHDSLGWPSSSSIVPIRISERGTIEAAVGKRRYGTLGGIGPRMRVPARNGARQADFSIAFAAPWIVNSNIPLGKVAFSGVFEVDYLGEREVFADVPLIAGATDRRGANWTRVLRASKTREQINASVLFVGPAANQFGGFDLIRGGVPVASEFSTWYQASARILGVHLRRCQLGNEQMSEPLAEAQHAQSPEPNEREGALAGGKPGSEPRQEVRLRSQTRRIIAHATVYQSDRSLIVVDSAPPLISGANAAE